jgi:acyl carrier protein
MPISTPPQNYDLNPTGTSGTLVGPEVVIVDDDLKVVPTKTAGNIMVRGPPCFGGYEGNTAANQESFFSIKGYRDNTRGSNSNSAEGKDGGLWFNTGDMGYLDEKGYLFISGRSKEIINRGGETISPFEIEEVLIQHPFVKEALAFSAPHETFQETGRFLSLRVLLLSFLVFIFCLSSLSLFSSIVGAILVIRPGKPKLDLTTLCKYLDNRLHRSKWPQILIFSTGLPKNAAGKTLRIKYADRIGLKSVDEESSPNSRLFEADNPPIGTPLTTKITLRPVKIDYSLTSSFLKKQSMIDDCMIVTVDLPSQQDAPIAFVLFRENTLEGGKRKSTDSMNSQKVILDGKSVDESKVIEDLLELCGNSLDCFLVPSFIYSLSSLPSASSVSVADLQKLALDLYQKNNIIVPRNSVEKQIELIWRSLLGSPTTISVKSSFFDLGGDSLKAGQLIGIMRNELRVPLTVADLFLAPSIEAMGIKISMSKTLGLSSPSPAINGAAGRRARASPSDLSAMSPSVFSPKNTLFPMMRNAKRRNAAKRYQQSLQTIEEEKQQKLHQEYMTWEFTPLLSSTTFSTLVIQALPITVIYPIRRIIIWFLIATPWVYFMKIGYGRFTSLLLAMVISRVILGILAPLTGIAAKWLIIGRYQPGKYPLWGSMYLKWWIVEQIINIMGKGAFCNVLLSPCLFPAILAFLAFRLFG